MKHWRAVVIVLLASPLLSSPALWSWSGASGVHSVIALFESHVHPDLPFDQFAAGRLGIIKPTWHRSYLYAAYRFLSGPGFDASEQKALVSMWDQGLDLEPGGDAAQDPLDAQRLLGVAGQTIRDTDEASAAWLAARSRVPGVPAINEIGIYRDAPSDDASFAFANCNDNAFRTALHTLDTMTGTFGLTSIEVRHWVDGQDQVFQNCSPGFSTNDWHAPQLTVEGVPPEVSASSVPAAAPTENASYIPEPLKNGTPLEKAQRSYQIAAANFYSGNFDTAAKMFEAIAADTSSPWRQLAPYLVARATIRKATLSADKNDHAMLAKAEAQLNEIIAGRGAADVKRAAQRLLGFVTAQLHPAQREEELARAVMLPSPADVLRQDVSDYIWMLDLTDHTGNRTNQQSDDVSHSDDLTDWISTMKALGQENADVDGLLAHSLARWKKISSMPWLVATISAVPAKNPDAPALIESAEKVRPDSPAFATVTYHTARLLLGQGKADEAREKLDSILARRAELPVSTVNELIALRMRLARNLNELLMDAQRTPLGFTDDADSEELPSKLDDTPAAETLKEPAAGQLFDNDGAAILTRWLPLSVLMQVARSQTLPASLRGQVALAAWVRAILLGNDAKARELATAVVAAAPKLKRSMDAWLASNSPDAQRFSAVYLILQNPGLRYKIDPGAGRLTPLDEIDSLRDNWWPAGVGQGPQTEAYPGFLSPAERKSADEEWQKLSTINAPNFLCTAAIAQAKTRSADERAPEALYQCLRAVHLGCSNSEGTNLAKSAFVLLHRRYPDSTWAEKGHVWYKGGTCG